MQESYHGHVQGEVSLSLHIIMDNTVYKKVKVKI